MATKSSLENIQSLAIEIHEVIEAGEFQSEEYIAKTVKNIFEILDNSDPSEKVEVEKEIAYLIKEIREKTNIVIAKNPLTIQIEEIESLLHKE